MVHVEASVGTVGQVQHPLDGVCMEALVKPGHDLVIVLDLGLHARAEKIERFLVLRGRLDACGH
jgi:hypothetical protein